MSGLVKIVGGREVYVASLEAYWASRPVIARLRACNRAAGHGCSVKVAKEDEDIVGIGVCGIRWEDDVVVGGEYGSDAEDQDRGEEDGDSENDNDSTL